VSASTRWLPGVVVAAVLALSAASATAALAPPPPAPQLPPDCARVVATPATLWPPDHAFEKVSLSGATDPEGDRVSLLVTHVTQDEPVAAHPGDPSPDARVAGRNNQIRLRRERLAGRDGRVYKISFTAGDGKGGSCFGTVPVTAPYAQGGVAGDSGGSENSETVVRSPLGAPRRTFVDAVARAGETFAHSVRIGRGVVGAEIVTSWDFTGRVDVQGIALLRGSKVSASKLRVSRTRSAESVVVRVHNLRPGTLRLRVRTQRVSQPMAVTTQVRAIRRR
jgi:hypothetical protein